MHIYFCISIIKSEHSLFNSIIERYTKNFEIYDDLTQPVNSYSHGMKQKLLISGALIPAPSLLENIKYRVLTTIIINLLGTVLLGIISIYLLPFTLKIIILAVFLAITRPCFWEHLILL
jgi:hypothetical protein